MVWYLGIIGKNHNKKCLLCIFTGEVLNGNPIWPSLQGIPRSYPGITLYPTLFNMVVDSVIYHWVKVVSEKEAGMEVLGLLIWNFLEYFYTDDGLVASTQPERMQRAFGVLAGLFDRVGLRMNMWKMVSMDC